MTEAGLAALQADIPMCSPQRRYRKLQSSMRMAAALGITTTTPSPACRLNYPSPATPLSFGSPVTLPED